MSEPESKAGASYRWLLFLLPVFYLLSTGPMLYLFKAMGEPKAMESFLEVAYYPIEWLWDKSDVFQALLEKYLDLFR